MLVLVVLAIMWAGALLPPLLRSRSEGRPSDSIGQFQDRLTVLERATPGTVAPAFRLHRSAHGGMAIASPAALARRHQQERRKQILLGLAGLAAVTLVLGLFMHQLLLVHLLVDALIAGYVGALVYLKNLAAERKAKLRFLPEAVQPTGDVPASLRTAVN